MKTTVILIDFENVQPKDLKPLRGRPCSAKIFCGAHQNKIPFDFAAELQPLGANAEYIQIHGIGANAVDFHIAYYLGRLTAASPEASYYVVSRDTGYDPLIKHLKSKGIDCHRSSSLAEIPVLAAVASPAPADLIRKAADSILLRKTAKPLRRKTLTSSIRAGLGVHVSDTAVEEVFENLKARGVEIDAAGKVVYPACQG